jgi:hypothetical protein
MYHNEISLPFFVDEVNKLDFILLQMKYDWVLLGIGEFT